MKKLQFSILLLTLVLAFVTKNASANIGVEASNSFSFNGEIGYLKPDKSPYLGTQIGAGPNVFNFVEAGNKLRFRAKGVSLYTAPFYGFKIFGQVQDGIANETQDFSTIDPAGRNLLIPGVGVGPIGVGFLLPGPNNQITDARYNTEYDFYKMMLGVEKKFKTSISSLDITPSFGVGYRRSVTRNEFVGHIPFFVRRFDYETKTRITTISPTLGIKASYAFTPEFEVFGGADYAYDINKGKGMDSLSFTGFSDQVAKIKNNENTHYHALKAGVNFKPKNFPIITLQGNYKKFGNVPVIKNRDSIQKSDFVYEEADVLSGTIRMTFEF